MRKSRAGQGAEARHTFLSSLPENIRLSSLGSDVMSCFLYLFCLLCILAAGDARNVADSAVLARIRCHRSESLAQLLDWLALGRGAAGGSIRRKTPGEARFP
jgi:hypothetical protein